MAALAWLQCVLAAAWALLEFLSAPRSHSILKNLTCGFSHKMEESPMATTPISGALNRGGAFLITPVEPENVFTPADLTDDQRLIGQTADEFVSKEVVPLIPELEQHK